MLSITNPRQTVLVSTRGKVEIIGKQIEKDNLITVDWHMPISFDPMMYAISIGKTRFSLKLIRKSRVFCVNFISKEMEKDAEFFGRHTGEHMNKFENIESEECEKIECLRLKNCVAFMECLVENEIETGDHFLFIAKVVLSMKNSNESRLFHMTGKEYTTTK